MKSPAAANKPNPDSYGVESYRSGHSGPHGGMGVSDDTWLASAYAHLRTLRLADGPDEVHREVIARLELKKEQ